MNKFDTVVIELQDKGKSAASISIKKIDLDTLQSMHGHEYKEIIADLAQTLIQSLNERNSN